jgi:hypothetical protein
MSDEFLMRAFVFAWLFAALPAHAGDLNDLILSAASKYSIGGTHTVTPPEPGITALSKTITIQNGRLAFNLNAMNPHFCTSATYLVFVTVLQDTLRKLDDATMKALLVHLEQKDGDGVWGRWNADGPGIAKLFADLGLGRNFTRWSEARPGDFMKVFWKDPIGEPGELGHAVIYLGSFEQNGQKFFRAWSSHTGVGMAVKTFPVANASRVIFSRLENPGAIQRANQLPAHDDWLFNLQRGVVSEAAVYKRIGVPMGGR